MDELIAKALLNTRSDAIIATDREGNIRFWNPGAERMFGHSHESALGQSLDLIIPQRLQARHWDGFRKVMSTGRSRYGEGEVLAVPALRAGGTTFSIEFTIVPLHDEAGRMVGMAAVIRDVTKRFTELQDLRRKLAEVAGRNG